MIRKAYENLVENHLIQEDMDEYNKKRDEFLSSTALKLLISESPADYKYDKDNPSFTQKPAFILGNAVHCLVLEGVKEYDKRYKIGGPKDSKGKELGITSDAFEFAREKVRKEEGKELITSRMHKTAMLMRKSCLKHYIVKDILSEGVSERVLRLNLMGVDCQVRFDWLSPKYGIPDLKTCRDLRFFVYEARKKYGYFYQAGLYQSLAYHTAPEFGYLPFCFIVVESRPPYKVGVFELDEDALEQYRHGVVDALILLNECRETDVWPTGYEDLQTITYQII